MSAFESGTAFASPAPQLGTALQTLLNELYRGWYTLLPKISRTSIDESRKELLPHFSTDADTQARNQALTRFADGLAPLSGVAEVIWFGVSQLQRALQDENAPLTEEERQKLAHMLATDDPQGYAIRQMSYNPDKVKDLYGAVQQEMKSAFPHLALSLQSQLEKIWARQAVALTEIDASSGMTTPIYQDALQELEEIPMVIRLTYHLFVEYKVAGVSQSQFNHSVEHGEILGLDEEQDKGIGWGDDEIALPDDSLDWRRGSALESLGSGPDVIDEGIGDVSESTETQFFQDVRFPEQVQIEDEVPLILQLTLEHAQESRASSASISFDFPDVNAPEYVDVVLNAPGFSEKSTDQGEWSRTIAVFADKDSQPAVFLLRAEEIGEQLLTLSFYHRGRHMGQVKVTSIIGKEPTKRGTSLTHDQAVLMAAPTETDAKPADLELRITQGGQMNRLSFMLHSTKAKIGYHWRPVGEIILDQADPQSYLEHKFERMSQLAGEVRKNSSEADVRKTMREIERMGEELFHDLFPDKLKAEYWRRIKPLREKGIVESFLITSDEPWIPWEMIKPYRYDDLEEIEEHDGFLCQTFQFCRWLAGRSPAERIQIQKVMTVVPRLDLTYAAREHEYLASLHEVDGVMVDGPLKSREQVLENVLNGGFDVLHFAVHGQFIAQQVNRSPLLLENNEELLPEDLSDSQIRGLRRSKPLVFLNACHTSRINFSLNGLGGWADRIVQRARASAFIGTLWEVDDELALAFSTDFYDQLRQDQPLGRAFSHAREHTRALSPANPTWLAYTLYGDPNSRVVWGD
ncbi:MAG: CHAT domain-containing protein [Chloroflexota bacterium]